MLVPPFDHARYEQACQELLHAPMLGSSQTWNERAHQYLADCMTCLGPGGEGADQAAYDISLGNYRAAIERAEHVRLLEAAREVPAPDQPFDQLRYQRDLASQSLLISHLEEHLTEELLLQHAHSWDMRARERAGEVRAGDDRQGGFDMALAMRDAYRRELALREVRNGLAGLGAQSHGQSLMSSPAAGRLVSNGGQ
jgi:hypothetical protein